MKERVIITGANGQLGKQLFEELDSAFDTISWYGFDSMLKDDIKTKVVA